jgi:DNA repair protein RadA
MGRTIIHLDLTNLYGVGPATRVKLIDAGYNRITDLIDADPKTVADVAEIGESTATKVIQHAKEIVVAIATGEYEVRV